MPKEKRELPVSKVLGMRKEGLPDEDIIRNLEREGHNYTQISEALNQADIKDDIIKDFPAYQYQEPEVSQLEQSAPVPSTEAKPSALYVNKQSLSPASEELQSSYQPAVPSGREILNQIEELVEAVVKEKWDNLTADMGNITLWKETISRDIMAVKQEILRVDHRLENLQKSVLDKVSDYNKNIEDIGSDVKALEAVFKKILTPLTSNVKELSKISADLRKIKKTRTTKKKKKA